MDDPVLQQAISESIVGVADLNDLDPDDRVCSICGDVMLSAPLTPETIDQNIAVKLGCGHIYGIGCINQWFRDHNTCPYCRASTYLIPPEIAYWRRMRERLHSKLQSLSEDPSIPVRDVAERLLHHLQTKTTSHRVPYGLLLSYLNTLDAERLGGVQALEDGGWTEYARFIEEDCIRDWTRYRLQLHILSDPSFEEIVSMLRTEVASCADMLGWEVLPEHVHGYLLYTPEEDDMERWETLPGHHDTQALISYEYPRFIFTALAF